jgi:hypothetical protein
MSAAWLAWSSQSLLEIPSPRPPARRLLHGVATAFLRSPVLRSKSLNCRWPLSSAQSRCRVPPPDGVIAGFGPGHHDDRHHHPEFRGRTDCRLDAAAGAARHLGPLVRPLQAPSARCWRSWRWPTPAASSWPSSTATTSPRSPASSARPSACARSRSACCSRTASRWTASSAPCPRRRSASSSTSMCRAGRPEERGGALRPRQGPAGAPGPGRGTRGLRAGGGAGRRHPDPAPALCRAGGCG